MIESQLDQSSGERSDCGIRAKYKTRLVPRPSRLKTLYL